MKGDESAFWKFVSTVGWKRQGGPFIEKAAGAFDVKQVKGFEKIYSKKFGQLYDALTPYWTGTKKPHIGLGDDSFSDLVSDIVGAGQRAYYAITPAKAARSSDIGGFDEGFSGVFQDVLDVKNPKKKKANQESVDCAVQ